MKIKHLVLFLFFSSGMSGLMYEVVWLRMMSRITGVTVYATATVLAAFMAGLALGSFVLGRHIDKRDDPLRVYAVLELLIAVSALIVPILLSSSVPIYRYVYHMTGESALTAGVIRWAISFSFLLLPTTMMGGTLPVLSACLVKRENIFGKNFSLLYGLNTLGAVTGVLIGGFITLESVGELATIYMAAAINIGVAVTAYVLYKREIEGGPTISGPEHAPGAIYKSVSPYSDSVKQVVLIAFAVSGLTALAYEVIWTRQLILFLKTSIYAFSGMLAVFLTGIALGSVAINRAVDNFRSPLQMFGILELIVGIISVVNLYLFAPLDSTWARELFGSARLLTATLVIVLPMTFVFGLIFPIAAVCYTKSVDRTGRSIGLLYSANTIGAIIGPMLTGFILIPVLGSTTTVLLLALLNVILGSVLILLEHGVSWSRKLAYVPVVLIFVVLALASMGKDPFFDVAVNRIVKGYEITMPHKKLTGHNTEIYFHKEGVEGTIIAFNSRGLKQLWINGIGMTLLCTETKLMTHLPLMFIKQPKDMLIVCFGMGTTLKSAYVYPDLNVTAVELVGETYETFKYFHPGSEDILTAKNVEMIVNDGRNYLLFEPKQYDVITVDPAPPIYSAGTVNLYTREFFQLCRGRLKSGGVMCLWVPRDRDDDMLAIVKTFMKEFPHVSVWISPRDWGIYLIGTEKKPSEELFRQNVEKVFKNRAIVNDLAEYNNLCVKPEQLYRMLLWSNDTARRIASKGRLITDNHPYTEFCFLRRLFNKSRRLQVVDKEKSLTF